MNALETKSIVDKVGRGQVRWLIQLIRTDNDLPVRKVWDSRIEHLSLSVRPTRTWNEKVEEILKQRGIDIMRVRTLPKDKK